MKKSVFFYVSFALLLVLVALDPIASFSQSESSGYESSKATTYTKTESRINSDGGHEYRTCYTYQIECLGSGTLSCFPTFESKGCTPWAP